MWKLNFKGYKNKKKLYKISKDFCAKFLNKSVILKIITDIYWKKLRIFTCAELCRFPEKSNKKNAAIWWIHRSPQIFTLKTFPMINRNWCKSGNINI